MDISMIMWMIYEITSRNREFGLRDKILFLCLRNIFWKISVVYKNAMFSWKLALAPLLGGLSHCRIAVTWLPGAHDTDS